MTLMGFCYEDIVLVTAHTSLYSASLEGGIDWIFLFRYAFKEDILIFSFRSTVIVFLTACNTLPRQYADPQLAYYIFLGPLEWVHNLYDFY